MFFFFKQKTAYEMRISDWSSDVCSSDLEVGGSTPPRPTILWLGALAQLGERLLCKHQVIGSIPISSTKVQMISGDEDSGLPALAGDMARSECFFDIVNGFFNRCRGDLDRSEERRVGKECVSTCRVRLGTD